MVVLPTPPFPPTNTVRCVEDGLLEVVISSSTNFWIEKRDVDVDAVVVRVGTIGFLDSLEWKGREARTPVCFISGTFACLLGILTWNDSDCAINKKGRSLENEKNIILYDARRYY